MYKNLLFTLALLIIFSVPVNITATEEVSFSLTDVSTSNSRLFETTLCVSDEVSAFVASFTFDEDALEFRSAKAVIDDAEISVNSSEEGNVKIAYLCESTASGELITLTFKSGEQSTYINLNAEQVIDSNSKDILVTSFKGAEISVTDALSQSKGNNQTSKSQTDTVQNHTESSAQSGTSYIEIPPKSGNNITFIICIAGGVILIFAVAAVAFILGRKTSAENKNNRKT